MSRFSYQYDYDLGSLDSTPTERSTFLENGTYENDVYEFDISGTRNINISLNNISAGDDADLSLYRDSNDNGVLDSSDELLTGSYRSGNADDGINYRASEGTYFARVNLYNGGSDSLLNYDLDLSATYPGSPSNVVAVDEDLGTLNGDITRYGSVGDTNTVDVYEFELGVLQGVNISLEGLSSDADIRLIQDRNNNGVVDSDEIISSSFNAGSSSESISQFQDIGLSGTYQLQVYQYSGNTNYQLNFDHYYTA